MPKEWLLEFLTSEDYNSITRKSKAHYAMIAAVAPRAPEGEEEELKEQGEYFPRRKILPLLSFAEIISFFNIEKEV